MSNDEKRKCTDKEVYFLPQEELESIRLCLKSFGLPTADTENMVQRTPKAITEEMFDVETQQGMSNTKC